MKENNTPTTENKEQTRLMIIGQDMHIMNPAFIQAVEQQDSVQLAAMAEQQVTTGANALDLNLGSTKKNRDQASWVVKTIQQSVNVRLFISSNVLSQPEILGNHRGTATINSLTADPASLAKGMETAKQQQARLVVLLVRPGLTPFTVNDRLRIAMEVLETADRVGFPLADLYLDPLFHLHPDPMTWQLSGGLPDIDSVLETIGMLPQLAEEKIHTIVALSSASQFLPQSERPGLHHRLLPMLMTAGLDAVILNCHDRKLMEIARNPEDGLEYDVSSIAQSSTDLNTAALHW